MGIITFAAWDHSGCTIEIEAASAEEAAAEYVSGGDWAEASETYWITVYVQEAGSEDVEPHKVVVEPVEPACDEEEHSWESPFEIVGGIKSNPGVFGHGGGVTIHEVCAHCGVHRHTDTWAQDRVDGTQGHTSVQYGAPEDFEEEEAWDDEGYLWGAA
jgi:hypothetical protein